MKNLFIILSIFACSCSTPKEATEVIKTVTLNNGITAEIKYYNKEFAPLLRSTSQLIIYKDGEKIHESYFREDKAHESIKFYNISGSYTKDEQGNYEMYGVNIKDYDEFSDINKEDILFAFKKTGPFNIIQLSVEEKEKYLWRETP